MKLRFLFFVPVFAFALNACQTAKPAVQPSDQPPASPDPSSIAVSSPGFSPNAAGRNAISFTVSVGSGQDVVGWSVNVSGVSGTAKTYTGDTAALPSILTWDGSTETGPAAEGAYTAELAVNYGNKFPPVSVKSASFVLDRTPPSVSLAASPEKLTSSADGVEAPMTVSIKAESALAKLDSWSIVIKDPAGSVFRRFEGSWPDATVSWDGKSDTGTLVLPALTYIATAEVRDEFGNPGSGAIDIPVAEIPPLSELAVAAPSASPPAAEGVKETGLNHAALTTEAAPDVVLPPEEADVPSSVTPSAEGFCPAGKTDTSSIGFKIVVGRPDAAVSWTLSIINSEGSEVRSFAGIGTEIPDSVEWYGTDASLILLPEGIYNAVLHVDYGSAFKAADASSPYFTLVRSSPTVTLGVRPLLLDPLSGEGIVFDVSTSSYLSRVIDWAIEVSDPQGKSFASFNGEGDTASLIWDARNPEGTRVEAATDYGVTTVVHDEFGNAGETTAQVRVDIGAVKVGDRYRVDVSYVVFKDFTADYVDVPVERAARNQESLDWLAAALMKFPAYKISIEGHAVMIYWFNAARGKKEQAEVLIPLSVERAEAVKQALVDRGIEPERLLTAGFGALRPIVPHSDLKNRWQNRRVEFFFQQD